MMLPRGIFDVRKSKTKDPKRKFAVKEYFSEITRNTKLLDLRSGDIWTIEEAIDLYGIIDVQLLDFAGSIFLDSKDWMIQPGFNKLFTRNEFDDESQLLDHKLQLVRFMRKFEHRNAMTELEQILKFGEIDENKFIEFRYTCLKGRILMRWRKFEEARIVFDKALSQLEHDFSPDEINSLTIKRLERLKSSFNDPNWDSFLVDYDEIYLNYLYSLLLVWNDDAEETNFIISNLKNTIAKAGACQSIVDNVYANELLHDIYKTLGDSKNAIKYIQSAISIIEVNKLNIDNDIYFCFLQLSLAELYASSNKFEMVDKIIFSLKTQADNSKSVVSEYSVLKVQLLKFEKQNLLDKSFEIGEKIINLYSDKKDGFTDTSPLGLVRDIFHHIIQGLFLKTFVKLEDIIDYIDLLNDLSDDSPIVGTYKKIIELRIKVYQLNETNFDEPLCERIEQQYDELLDKTKSDKLRYCIVVLHYYDFLLQKSNFHEVAIEKLFNLSNKVVDPLISSPYGIIIIKNEIINKSLSGKLSLIKSKLGEIVNRYENMELKILLDLLEKFETDQIDTRELIGLIIRNELYFTNFETQLNIPTEQFLT